MEREILALVQAYLAHTEESYEDGFLLLLIGRVIDDYKTQRNYPESLDDDAIAADVEKYFGRRKNYVATEVIPAILGKVGGEGLYSLVDNQVSRNWKYPLPIYLPDVVPYCEVI